MSGDQVSLVLTINGETFQMNLRECDVEFQNWPREIVRVRPQPYREWESTDDITITINGKRS